MRATLSHVIFTYMTCGLTCFIVYVMKWPDTGWQETEANYIYYSFWQLLGLIAQMLTISAALFLCIAYDRIAKKILILTVSQRRLMAVVAVINVMGGLINASSGFSRSMAATFLLSRYDQLWLYILPLAVSVIQIILALIFLLELDIFSSDTYRELPMRRLDQSQLSLLMETTLSNHDTPYIIITPDQLQENAERKLEEV